MPYDKPGDLIGLSLVPRRKTGQTRSPLHRRAGPRSGSSSSIVVPEQVTFHDFVDVGGAKKPTRVRVRRNRGFEERFVPYTYRGTGRSDPLLDAQWEADNPQFKTRPYRRHQAAYEDRKQA